MGRAKMEVISQQKSSSFHYLSPNFRQNLWSRGPPTFQSIPTVLAYQYFTVHQLTSYMFFDGKNHSKSGGILPQNMGGGGGIQAHSIPGFQRSWHINLLQLINRRHACFNFDGKIWLQLACSLVQSVSNKELRWVFFFNENNKIWVG